jgi:FRG domain-containing protein
MQHYGLPTRLLDWSYSALVAAYFATKYERDMPLWKSDREAAIWLLQPETLCEAQGYGAIFPSLNARSLSDLVQEAFRDIPTASNLKTYDVIAAVPVNRDLRMVMQHGAFTIHASDVPLEMRANRHAWLRKILIPRENVAGIALSLDVLGVRLSDVFPDVDHLAIELGQMHRPNP